MSKQSPQKSVSSMTGETSDTHTTWPGDLNSLHGIS